jgi:hypothetical protein
MTRSPWTGGDDPLALDRRNDFDNLILACADHNHLIDDKNYEQDYPVERLREFKREHEQRIALLTASGPELKTHIVRLKANVGEGVVDIPLEKIREAIFPYYPADLNGTEIDLTKFAGNDTSAYWQTAAAAVEKAISEMMAPRIDGSAARHVSVFALGPIPLLVKLGHCLGNKLHVEFYHRHRDDQDWKWKTTNGTVKYKHSVIREGTVDSKVGLVLSMSGTIPLRDLPNGFAHKYPIHEITLDGLPPTPLFLKTRGDVTEFKLIYETFLRGMKRDYPGVKELHIFPATPPPIAVMCGIVPFRKIDPALIVYDNNKKGGFKRKLKVN